MFRGETDARLDKGVEAMKEMIDAIKDVNKTLVDMNSNLGSKIDLTNEKQNELLIEVRSIGKDQGEKMDKSLAKQDHILAKQDELLVEVKDMNDIIELKADVSEVKAALRAKGLF